MLTIKDLDFKNKKVLVRCDFNVPIDESGNILDDFKIKKTLPTIKYLLEKEAKIILMCHLDDPGGKVVERLRLDQVQRRISELLSCRVVKTEDCIGQETQEEVNKMSPGEILLLENLRFHKGEEENDPDFAKKLSELGEIYINEAFPSSHRAHASIVGVPNILPSAAGILLEREVSVLSGFLKDPKKPVISIIGGKKVETKVKLIDKVSELADWVLIGGLIKREVEEKGIEFKYPQKIIKPVDLIGTFDLGPKTIEIFREKILKAKTVFWNGPLGNTEQEKYAKGTKEIVKAIIESGAFSVAGGGETVEFINKKGLIDKFNHVSVGGGAMLDFICDGEITGVEALKNH